MGDSLPEDLGFLTLNPLVHLNFFSIMLNIIFQVMGSSLFVGFGTYIPLDRDAIEGRFRWLKVFFAQMADVFVPFLVSVLSVFLLVIFYSYKAILLIANPLSFRSTALILGAHASYLAIFGTCCLLAFFVFNYFLTVFNFFINVCSLLGYALRYGRDDSWFGDFVEIAGIFIVWIFLAPIISAGVHALVINMVQLLTYVVGIA